MQFAWNPMTFYGQPIPLGTQLLEGVRCSTPCAEVTSRDSPLLELPARNGKAIANGRSSAKRQQNESSVSEAHSSVESMDGENAVSCMDQRGVSPRMFDGMPRGDKTISPEELASHPRTTGAMPPHVRFLYTEKSESSSS